MIFFQYYWDITDDHWDTHVCITIYTLYIFTCMWIFIYIFSWVYMYIKSSFPKHDKRLHKNRVYNANANFRDHVFEISSSYISTYISIYTYIWKALCPNTIYELGIGITSPFLGVALIVLWKRALCICSYINAYIYIYICKYTRLYSNTFDIHKYPYLYMHNCVYMHIYISR